MSMDAQILLLRRGLKQLVSQDFKAALRESMALDITKLSAEEKRSMAARILQLDLHERREDEINTLKALTEPLDFFSKINQKRSNQDVKLHEQICRRLKYESFSKGQIAIHFGAKADKFFIILNGEVSIFLAKSQETIEKEEKQILLGHSRKKYFQGGFGESIDDYTENPQQTNPQSTSREEPSGSQISQQQQQQQQRQTQTVKQTQIQRRDSIHYAKTPLQRRDSMMGSSTPSSSRNRSSQQRQNSPFSSISSERKQSVLMLDINPEIVDLTPTNNSPHSSKRKFSLKPIARVQVGKNGEPAERTDEINTPASDKLTDKQRFSMFRSSRPASPEAETEADIEHKIQRFNFFSPSASPLKLRAQAQMQASGGITPSQTGSDDSSLKDFAVDGSTPSRSGFSQMRRRDDISMNSSSNQGYGAGTDSQMPKSSFWNKLRPMVKKNMFGSDSPFQKDAVLKNNNNNLQFKQNNDDNRSRSSSGSSYWGNSPRRNNKTPAGAARATWNLTRVAENYRQAGAFGDIHPGCIESLETLFTDTGVFKFDFRSKLRAGSTFGELGILDGKPRSALIICSADSEFAIMEKDDYSELLAERDRRHLIRKFEFLKQHIFPDLTNDAIKKIFYAFQKKTFLKNEVIFSQGDTANGVYLIKKGEVQLTHSITRTKAMDNLEDSIDSYNDSNINQLEKQQEIHELFNNPSKIVKKTFATIGRGEYFGEEDLLLKQHNRERQFTAKCTSIEATIYFVEANFFLRFLRQKPTSMSIILRRLAKKQLWRTQQNERPALSLLQQRTSSQPHLKQRGPFDNQFNLNNNNSTNLLTAFSSQTDRSHYNSHQSTNNAHESAPPQFAISQLQKSSTSYRSTRIKHSTPSIPLESIKIYYPDKKHSSSSFNRTTKHFNYSHHQTLPKPFEAQANSPKTNTSDPDIECYNFLVSQQPQPTKLPKDPSTPNKLIQPRISSSHSPGRQMNQTITTNIRNIPDNSSNQTLLKKFYNFDTNAASKILALKPYSTQTTGIIKTTSTSRNHSRNSSIQNNRNPFAFLQQIQQQQQQQQIPEISSSSSISLTSRSNATPLKSKRFYEPTTTPLSLASPNKATEEYTQTLPFPKLQSTPSLFRVCTDRVNQDKDKAGVNSIGNNSSSNQVYHHHERDTTKPPSIISPSSSSLENYLSNSNIKPSLILTSERMIALDSLMPSATSLTKASQSQPPPPSQQKLDSNTNKAAPTNISKVKAWISIRDSIHSSLMAKRIHNTSRPRKRVMESTAATTLNSLRKSGSTSILGQFTAIEPHFSTATASTFDQQQLQLQQQSKHAKALSTFAGQMSHPLLNHTQSQQFSQTSFNNTANFNAQRLPIKLLQK